MSRAGALGSDPFVLQIPNDSGAFVTEDHFPRLSWELLKNPSRRIVAACGTFPCRCCFQKDKRVWTYNLEVKGDRSSSRSETRPGYFSPLYMRYASRVGLLPDMNFDKEAHINGAAGVRWLA